MECTLYDERTGRTDSVRCGLGDDSCRVVLKELRELEAHRFGWVRLDDPTEAELVGLAAELGLHPLAVEDALHPRQRPKSETFGDVLAIALKTLWYVPRGNAVETGQVMLFAGPRYVLTVRHGPADPAGEAARRLGDDPALLRYGPLAVVHAVLDVVVDAYGDAAGKARAALTRLEDSVFSVDRTDVTEDIYSLKREVREFRDAVQPLVPVVHGLLNRGEEPYPAQALPYLRDVADHLARTDTEVRTLDELLNAVLDAQQARVASWQNDDMRRISAWAAIFAVPTMVAGVYGMNFRHMPELGWSYGYPLALGIMAAASGLLYRAFRRNGWL
ncbi:magnesium and cobalt transport protein CorA [Streptomyces globosus]|uniref:magnesium and cobalt transport protein CorA n=1 Tax=Streptomyces globosus TaxID=68209 RepID=UPI00380BE414